jgi:hypothetical protein
MPDLKLDENLLATRPRGGSAKWRASAEPVNPSRNCRTSKSRREKIHARKIRQWAIRKQIEKKESFESSYFFSRPKLWPENDYKQWGWTMDGWILFPMEWKIFLKVSRVFLKGSCGLLLHWYSECALLWSVFPSLAYSSLLHVEWFKAVGSNRSNRTRTKSFKSKSSFFEKNLDHLFIFHNLTIPIPNTQYQPKLFKSKSSFFWKIPLSFIFLNISNTQYIGICIGTIPNKFVQIKVQFNNIFIVYVPQLHNAKFTIPTYTISNKLDQIKVHSVQKNSFTIYIFSLTSQNQSLSSQITALLCKHS